MRPPAKAQSSTQNVLHISLSCWKEKTGAYLTVSLALSTRLDTLLGMNIYFLKQKWMDDQSMKCGDFLVPEVRGCRLPGTFHPDCYLSHGLSLSVLWRPKPAILHRSPCNYHGFMWVHDPNKLSPLLPQSQPQGILTSLESSSILSLSTLQVHFYVPLCAISHTSAPSQQQQP